MFSLLSIAPMIDWTNTHFRVFMRLIAPKALLYTEMQTFSAIKHNPKRALGFSCSELPLALQLGGSNAKELVEAALLAETYGFSEINLNIGCPSDRVKAGHFGACLMAKPLEVAAIVKALKEQVSIPITVKTRIGIDHEDSYEFFADFAHSMVNAGSDKLIIHARKAWLKGLSPKQNRTIPPINYDFVYRLKKELSGYPIIINGNIETIDAIKTHLTIVDGVMLGRLACSNPFAITAIHAYLYPDTPIKKRSDIIKEYTRYLIQQKALGVPLSILLKPLYAMAHGLANGRHWKNLLMLDQQNQRLDNLNAGILFIEENEL